MLAAVELVEQSIAMHQPRDDLWGRQLRRGQSGRAPFDLVAQASLIRSAPPTTTPINSPGCKTSPAVRPPLLFNQEAQPRGRERAYLESGFFALGIRSVRSIRSEAVLSAEPVNRQMPARARTAPAGA